MTAFQDIKKRQDDAGKSAIQRLREKKNPTPAPIVTPDPEPVVQQDPSQNFQARAHNALAGVLGLPVDALTSAINTASELVTGEELIDPSRVIGGQQSFLDFGAGTRAGLETVGRGFGLVDEQTPEQIEAQKVRSDQSPSFFGGELFGETAPFLVPAAKVGQIASLPLRTLATGTLAATEGAVVTKGQGKTFNEILQNTAVGGGLGITFEVLFPVASRLARKIVSRFKGKTPGGDLLDKDLNPTPEFQKILDQEGISFEDFQRQAIDDVQEGFDPIQVERAKRFKDQNIPTTTGVITQDDILLGREETALGRIDEIGGVISAPLRERKRETSMAFERNAEELIDDLGLADDVGNSIKDALTQRRKLLVREKNALYKAATEADPELTRVPIIADNIVDAIPDAKTIKRLGRIKGSQIEGLQDLLVEFGLDQDPKKVKDFLSADNIIEPLSFSNFEDFRQALNQLARADQTGATGVVVSPILNVLDKELDIAFEAVSTSPNIQGNTLDLLKEARSKVRELKVEFDPKGLTDKLISFKKGGNIPNVEASQIYKSIAAHSVSVEATKRLVKSLSKGGDVGKRALGDLQATTVMQALEAALSATSNKSGGRQLFSPNAFVKELRRIDAGQGKLDVIFANNREMLKTLRNLEKSAKETVTPSSTKPKGSAPAVNAVLVGVFNGMRSIPGAKQISDATEIMVLGTRAKDALNAIPQQVKAIEYINREFPALAAVAGVGVSTRTQEEEK